MPNDSITFLKDYPIDFINFTSEFIAELESLRLVDLDHLGIEQTD